MTNFLRFQLLQFIWLVFSAVTFGDTHRYSEDQALKIELRRVNSEVVLGQDLEFVLKYFNNSDAPIWIMAATPPTYDVGFNLSKHRGDKITPVVLLDAQIMPGELSELVVIKPGKFIEVKFSISSGMTNDLQLVDPNKPTEPYIGNVLSYFPVQLGVKYEIKIRYRLSHDPDTLKKDSRNIPLSQMSNSVVFILKGHSKGSL